MSDYLPSCIPCRKNKSCKLCAGAAVEREHRDLYREIKSRGLPSEDQFYKRIAAAHIKERPDYYTLLKRYVES